MLSLVCVGRNGRCVVVVCRLSCSIFLLSLSMLMWFCLWVWWKCGLSGIMLSDMKLNIILCILFVVYSRFMLVLLYVMIVRFFRFECVILCISVIGLCCGF